MWLRRGSGRCVEFGWVEFFVIGRHLLWWIWREEVKNGDLSLFSLIILSSLLFVGLDLAVEEERWW